jgi:hypothetical protein
MVAQKHAIGIGQLLELRLEVILVKIRRAPFFFRVGEKRATRSLSVSTGMGPDSAARNAAASATKARIERTIFTMGRRSATKPERKRS